MVNDEFIPTYTAEFEAVVAPCGYVLIVVIIIVLSIGGLILIS